MYGARRMQKLWRSPNQVDFTVLGIQFKRDFTVNDSAFATLLPASG